MLLLEFAQASIRQRLWMMIMTRWWRSAEHVHSDHSSSGVLVKLFVLKRSCNPLPLDILALGMLHRYDA